jgi:putative SOS response-associated peptidase YedK
MGGELDWRRWNLLCFAVRLEEPMKIYPVSDLVNSPKTDDARCIEPVRIDRDFFERQWWGDG